MLLLFASIILYAWRAKAAAGKKSWLISQIKKSWFEIFVVLILLLPGVISVLVIYPRSHYLLVSWVLFGFAIIVLLTKGVGEQERRPYEEILLICGLALLLVRPVAFAPGSVTQPNIKVIEYLRSLNISRPVNILEAEGGYGIYVGDQYRRISEYSKNEPWGVFLDTKDINLIVLSDSLVNDTRFVGDQEWLAFLAEPFAWGFRTLDIPGVENRKLL